ncbi:hypothetical protein [Paraburkholderia sp. RL17-337-BIB-A]|uniref:hypothetical protein n=1 Tax=Paraburkholderia sp. RL17-337-BIB-A TaxID=3031636 RepID=UPI0038B8630F
MAAVCWPRLQDFGYSQKDVNSVAAVNAWDLRTGTLALSVILLAAFKAIRRHPRRPKKASPALK